MCKRGRESYTTYGPKDWSRPKKRKFNKFRDVEIYYYFVCFLNLHIKYKREVYLHGTCTWLSINFVLLYWGLSFQAVICILLDGSRPPRATQTCCICCFRKGAIEIISWRLIRSIKSLAHRFYLSSHGRVYECPWCQSMSLNFLYGHNWRFPSKWPQWKPSSSRLIMAATNSAMFWPICLTGRRNRTTLLTAGLRNFPV
jgi:hypothetical protein